MKRYLVAMILGIFALSFMSAYTSYSPEFNGDWENGAILTTDFYHIDDGMFYSKNAYPIKGEKVCETNYKTMKKRVCEVQVSYIDRTKTVCKRIDGQMTCEKQTYQYPVRRNICHYETYEKPYTRCQYTNLPIICENPSGEKTNALLSENFEYQMQGEDTWNAMPTLREDWSFNLKNEDVRFRVTIPEVCSPKYDIDKAIVITER
jgi:hypothetical protein